MVKVVDGDTIEVNLAGRTETVRLIGIDTPETVDQRTAIQCFGPEASDYAKSVLTSGLNVRLEPDPSQDDRDRYGRLLRYVWLPDGVLFNLQTIAAGYAREYTYDRPYKYQTQFKTAEAQAREAEIGLWSPSTCGGNTEQAASPPLAQQQAQPAPGAVGQPQQPAQPPPQQQPPAASGGRFPPVGQACPPNAPIKGNRSSSGEWIYHRPGQQAYTRTIPEECFATEKAASDAGYRPAQR